MATAQHLPEAVLEEILIRLPVKSLLRLRCVCRSWKALIQSPSFVAAHLRFNRPPPSAANRKILANQAQSSVRLLSGDALDHSEPLDFPIAEGLRLVGSCDGIVCAAVHSRYFLWNPATRKFKVLPDSCIPTRNVCGYFVRFGFDPKSNDYKVVRIVNLSRPKLARYGCPKRVEVYSLKTGSWREIQSTLPDHILIVINGRCCDGVLNGALFWCGFNIHERRIVFVLFDVENEVFNIIEQLPWGDAVVAMVLDKPVALIAEVKCEDPPFIHVWVVMNYIDDDDDEESWAKHFPKQSLPQRFHPLGSMDSGELLIVDESGIPFFYCPVVKEMRNIAVSVDIRMTEFVSYSESLVSIQGQDVLDIIPDKFFFHKLKDSPEG